MIEQRQLLWGLPMHTNLEQLTILLLAAVTAVTAVAAFPSFLHIY